MSEEQPEYQIAYVSPPIQKAATNYVLPQINIDDRWMAWHGGDKYGIYFIQSAEGYIKIGKSNDMFRRLGNYRTHHPMMRLVGVITPAPAYIDYNENLLHRLWEPFIVSLEWFAPVRPLVEYIRLFDDFGDGHPLELISDEPATWQELLEVQRGIWKVRR